MTRFRSFFMGGFECATGPNRHGNPMDQVCATQHDRFVAEDYRLLSKRGIRTVREGVRWPLVDIEGRYDFDSLDPMLQAAEDEGMELIFDLFHYGYPEDLDIFSPEFVTRFEEYCRACAKYIWMNLPGPYYFTPVNEPSFFAYAAGEACLFGPRECGRGYELKLQLARAAIRGIEAIWQVIPEARIVNVDPVCRVVPPRDRPDLADEAKWFNEVAVFESFDMIAGRLHPELGGSRRHLDIVGVNYYWTNQWEHTKPGIPLSEDDERLWSVGDLVRWVWHRYGGEVCITETAHGGENRAPFLFSLGKEAEALVRSGVPLTGVCLYPILGMPEWHEPEQWARLGLWDLMPGESGTLERVPYRPALGALRVAQARVEHALSASEAAPNLDVRFR